MAATQALACGRHGRLFHPLPPVAARTPNGGIGGARARAAPSLNGRFPIDQPTYVVVSGGSSWSQAPTAGLRSLTGPCWRVRHRQPCADNGPSRTPDRTAGVDPLPTFLAGPGGGSGRLGSRHSGRKRYTVYVFSSPTQFFPRKLILRLCGCLNRGGRRSLCANRSRAVSCGEPRQNLGPRRQRAYDN
jgi:hypothetical protein